MNRNYIDKQIADHLKKETDDVTKLKEETWEKINNELFTNQVPNANRGKRKRFITAVTIAALITIAWIGLTTTTGQALIQNLKDMFVEEKDVELNIEGNKEDTHVELETNEELNYVIYIDKSRYKRVDGKAGDQIVPGQKLGDEFPEVSMEIIYKEETTTEETVQEIKEELKNLNLDITREEEVTTPFVSTMISGIGKGYTNEHGKTGTQWDTPVYKYYVTEDQEGKLFVVKQIYFLEAAEGHGVRFDSMLETFEVIR